MNERQRGTHALARTTLLGAIVLACDGPQSNTPRANPSTLAGWHARVMQIVHEPSLITASLRPQTTVLRFTWSPSFDPLVVVRVSQTPTRCDVYTATATLHEIEWGPPDSTGFSTPLPTQQPPTVVHDSTTVPIALCADLTNAFAVAANASPGESPMRPVMDGSGWLFETRDAKGYQTFSRRSPDSTHDAALMHAGVAALKLGRALTPQTRIY